MPTEMETELRRQNAELEQQSRSLADDVDSLISLRNALILWSQQILGAKQRTLDSFDRNLLLAILSYEMRQDKVR